MSKESVKIKLYNHKLEVVSEEVIDASTSQVLLKHEVLTPVVHRVLLAQNQWHRKSISNTKGRSDVRGGGKKPYKQKGTGTARRGSETSPIMIGGGIVFGPKPRKVSNKVNKKEMKIALLSMLSDKFASQKFYLIDKFDFKAPKAKEVLPILDKVNQAKSLFVDVNNSHLKMSVANHPKAKYLEACGLNVYDLLKYENLFLTKASLTLLKSRFKTEIEAISK